MSDPIDIANRIRDLTDDQRREFLCWLSGYQWDKFAGWLDRWQARQAEGVASTDAPVPVGEHRVAFILTAGGVFSIRCRDCDYSATAPTERAAIVATSEHRAGRR